MKELIGNIEKILLENKIDNYKKTDDSIMVLPKNKDNFKISLNFLEGEILVFFDSWHSHFDDKNSALGVFLFGLTSECRLRVLSKKKKEFEWRLEVKRNDKWKFFSATSLFELKFWIKNEVKYLMNNLITEEKFREMEKLNFEVKKILEDI